MFPKFVWLPLSLCVSACASPTPSEEGTDDDEVAEESSEGSADDEAEEASESDEGEASSANGTSTSATSTSSTTGQDDGTSTTTTSTSSTTSTTGSDETTSSGTTTGTDDGEVPGGGCADADILCETFESIASGALPGAPWQLNPSCPDLGSVSLEVGAQPGVGVDGSVGLSSSGASTGTNYCAPLIELGSQTTFWVTTKVMISGEIDMQHEVTFFELGPDTSENGELRVGYRGDNSCPGPDGPYQGFELAALNGPTGEYTGCTGMKPVADQWYCLEVFVDQSGGNAEAALSSEFYIDGERKSMLVHMQEHDTILSTATVSYIKIGMQSYGGEFAGIVLDDFSISTTRVGCG